mgnify:CR=1 FL=1
MDLNGNLKLVFVRPVGKNNDDLYEYSKESFVEFGYQIEENDTNYFADFRTEYEDKFMSKGNPIYYIKIKK